jgi:co-chaperonin GroES (HSP10)
MRIDRLVVGRAHLGVRLEVKVGQRVLIGHYVGITVKIDGQDVVLMKEGEIAWVEQ